MSPVPKIDAWEVKLCYGDSFPQYMSVAAVTQGGASVTRVEAVELVHQHLLKHNAAPGITVTCTGGTHHIDADCVDIL